jgi:predicted NUDIX family NTP pyrophosphohydrolase
MPKRSAGLLLFRHGPLGLEVLLGHPGGPFWQQKDDGAWGITKGEYDDGETPEAVADREFEEETGYPAPSTPRLALGEIRKKSGKVVVAWAAEGDLDPVAAVSNLIPVEWPPRSGELIDVRELDRVEWFDPVTARRKIGEAEAPFIDRLEAALADSANDAAPGTNRTNPS